MTNDRQLDRPFRSPFYSLQVFDLREVPIPRHQGQIVLESNRRNPDVILWNHPPPGTQIALDSPVQPRRLTIDSNDRAGIEESLDPRNLILVCGCSIGSVE